MLSLLAPLSSLRGVGDIVLKQLDSLLPVISSGNNGRKLRDLLFHLPVNLVDRRAITLAANAEMGVEQVFQVRVIEHIASAPRHIASRRKLPYRIVVADDSDQIILTFFHANPTFLTRLLPVGSERLIAGKPARYDGQLTIAHPPVIVPLAKKSELLRVHPVYPASAKIGSKAVAKLVREAVSQLASPPEWIDSGYLKSYNWPDMPSALRAIHLPQDMEALALHCNHRTRLAYDEILAHQMMLAHLRSNASTENHHIISCSPSKINEALASLSFTLTGAQHNALQDILSDMASTKPMARMVQGDVGCGKTAVAFLAMAACAFAGKQSLLMAPTDLLARQHFESLLPLSQALGLRMELLTGKLSAKDRKVAKAAIQQGHAQLIIGTHALFQEDVAFDNLALAVIDEQHRFGVNQRKRLSEKGLRPHMLHMSATPIPRSLTMTLYGDLDISIIGERPAGRLPIDTRAMPQAKANDLIQSLGAMFEKGERVYWVCPLVTPDPESDEGKEEAFAAAETRYRQLETIFPGQVGLVHGQMPLKQREEAMQAFAKGDTSLLVATTVIEVGVNVPEATIMIIDQAERFGLAQLHQLRGRVGRGSRASHCILLYGERLSDVARERLKIIRDEQDGFVLAEEDMRLRGSGDLLGTKQTGLPEFIFANLMSDQALFKMAREQISKIMKQDPALESEHGKAIRFLLDVFGYDIHFAEKHTI